MTDTSLPADETSSEVAASTATADTGASPPAESAPAPAEGSSPVTEHPAHDIVSELLDLLRLQGVENVFRSVFEWLGRHADAIGGMAGKIAPPPAPAETADTTTADTTSAVQ